MFCGNPNHNPEEYADESCAQYPEFTRKVVEYIDPTQQFYPSTSMPEPAYFFIIDASFVQKDIEVA